MELYGHLMEDSEAAAEDMIQQAAAEAGTLVVEQELRQVRELAAVEEAHLKLEPLSQMLD
jgi:hypothetical protein